MVVLSSPSMPEPGVVGIRRPRLLLPKGIVERLTPAQLRAVIAHERCHVRCHDNLAAAIHTVAEAIFFRRSLVVGAALLACTIMGASCVDFFLLGSPLGIAL